MNSVLLRSYVLALDREYGVWESFIWIDTYSEYKESYIWIYTDFRIQRVIFGLIHTSEYRESWIWIDTYLRIHRKSCIYLSVYLPVSICLTLDLSVCVSICLYLSDTRSICLCIYLSPSIWHWIYLSVYLSFSIYLTLDLSVYHTGLTRVSSIRFLLFEIKRVLVFNSIIIFFTDLFVLYIFIQNAYVNKKVCKKKTNKLCLMGQIVIESHSFLEYWQNR